jgi:DNA-binding Xre family transcriptional regulator
MKIEIHVEASQLGSRIKKARLKDARSLLAICREIEMTPQNWYGIEKEVNKAIPLQTFLKICSVLGTDFGVDLKEKYVEATKIDSSD